MGQSELKPSVLSEQEVWKEVIKSTFFILYLSLFSYGIISGSKAIEVFFERTVQDGVLATGFHTFLIVFLNEATLFTLIIVFTSAASGYVSKITPISVIIPPAVLSGITLAIFGVPPVMTNVIQPTIIGGILLGLIGLLFAYAIPYVVSDLEI